MSPEITVVITVHHDQAELSETIASIRATAGMVPPIVVVDDGSPKPMAVNGENIRLIRNGQRVGVGPSRHIGVMAAETENILVIDSHMRFQPGWYEQLRPRVVQHPRSIICCVCLGLDEKHMDPNNPCGVYHGATINVLGHDPNLRNRNGRPQVLEAIWQKTWTEDNAEIPACMGASYAFHRDWFGYIDPLRFLRGWGEDEIMLSLKSWLCGGDVRLHTGVRIGHKFRSDRARIPYRIGFDERGHNKLFAILTLMPEPLRAKLLPAFTRQPNSRPAWDVIKKNMGGVLAEEARNRAMFKRDFYFLAQKFGLQLP